MHIDPTSLNPTTIMKESRALPDVHPEALLLYYRKLAEAKLIKSYLLKKLHEGQTLTAIDKQYISHWKKQIVNCKNEDQLSFTCLPNKPTDMRIEELSGIDKYNLNSIPLVKFSPEMGKYGVTDIILELSHFLDDSTIGAVNYYI